MYRKKENDEKKNRNDNTQILNLSVLKWYKMEIIFKPS